MAPGGGVKGAKANVVDETLKRYDSLGQANTSRLSKSKEERRPARR